MALSLPRFKVGVGRQKLELQLHWAARGLSKEGASWKKKKSLVRTPCGTYVSFTGQHLEFHSNLYYSMIMY